MRDDTVTYLLLGGLTIYLLTKKSAAPVLPTGTVSVGPLQTAPYSQQSGLLLPFFNSVLNSVNSLTNKPVDASGLTFTPITSTPTDSPVLSVTDSTGVTAFSNGGIFDPNQGLVSPATLATPVIPSVDSSIYDYSEDE